MRIIRMKFFIIFLLCWWWCQQLNNRFKLPRPASVCILRGTKLLTVYWHLVFYTFVSHLQLWPAQSVVLDPVYGRMLDKQSTLDLIELPGSSVHIRQSFILYNNNYISLLLLHTYQKESCIYWRCWTLYSYIVYIAAADGKVWPSSINAQTAFWPESFFIKHRRCIIFTCTSTLKTFQ